MIKKIFEAVPGTMMPSPGMLLRTGLAVMLACALTACGREQKSIVILYENDVHCNLDGYARLRGLADRVADTAYVAITSSGDFLHGGKAGAISEGSYITAIMKNMDYAAVGLGNHEFDFHVPRLCRLMEESGLPVVNLNLRTMPGDSLLFQPYILRDYGGTRVALHRRGHAGDASQRTVCFLRRRGTTTFRPLRDAPHRRGAGDRGPGARPWRRLCGAAFAPGRGFEQRFPHQR